MGTNFRIIIGAVLIAALVAGSVSAATPKTLTTVPAGCCTGTRGNVNGQGIVDLADLAALVQYLTNTGYVPPCMASADLSGDGLVDLLDLSTLVAYLVGEPTTLKACPGDTTPMPIPVRLAAIDSVTGKYASLSGQTHDSVAHALLTYLKSRPEFEDAGISGGTTVWGRFTDGRVLIIPNNKDPDYPADSGSVDTVSDTTTLGSAGPTQPDPNVLGGGRSLVRTALAGEPVELPESGDAYLLSSMSHNCFSNPLPTIKALLERQHYNCHVFEGEYASNGTISNLMTVNDAGLLYFDGHGGEGKLRDSTPLYGLWTADVVYDGAETANAAMLAANELCYMIEVGKVIRDTVGCDTIAHYGITPAFVSHYMHFAKNSLVYIDACSSNEANMQTAFTNAKASVYLGWTAPVKVAFALKTSYYLFDRLLGTNAIANRENPPQRPFDIQALFADMTNRGLTLDPSTGSDIVETPLQDHFGLLAPTIKFVSIYEDATKPHMLISGEFGSDRGTHGTVTMNGQPVFVQFWSPDTLLCDLDATGPQATGKVQAYVIPTVGTYTPDSKALSNPVNISEWNGQIEYTLSGPDSLLADLKMGVHFRGDVHNFREKPHQKPFKTLALFQSGLKDSTGKATWSGEHDIPTGPCVERLVMSGSDSMGNVWQPADHGAFKYDGGVDMIHNQVQFNLTYGAGDTVGHMHYGGPAGCPTTDFTVYLQVQNDSCLFNVLPSDVMQVTMNIDTTDFSIKPDSTSCSRKAIYWIYYFDQLSADAKLKWNKMTTKYRPDPRAGE